VDLRAGQEAMVERRLLPLPEIEWQLLGRPARSLIMQIALCRKCL